MNSPSVGEVVRCLLYDLGTFDAAIRYAEKIAQSQACFAWEYAQAAEILKERKLAAQNKEDS